MSDIKVLYVFITHQSNLKNCYDRIVNMMCDIGDFLIIQGGSISDEYDSKLKLLSLNCNDEYIGLPEKVMKTLQFIIKNGVFDQYTHICKLDDDMIVLKKFNALESDYIGNVHYGDGSRSWHMGRCGNFWDKIPYLGDFTPWCMGGYGYVISRSAIEKIVPNFKYLSHIYEDVYIALVLKEADIYPVNLLDIKEYITSPDHI